jgi:threonine dehydrogenase-like Zn-dependent dehydrogenase
MSAEYRQNFVGVTIEAPKKIGYREQQVDHLPRDRFGFLVTNSATSPGTELVPYAPPTEAAAKLIEYPVRKTGYANTAVVERIHGTTSLLQEGDRISINLGHRTGGIEEIDGREVNGRDSKDRWVKLPDDVDNDLGTLAIQMFPIALVGVLTAADEIHGTKLSTLEGSLKGQQVMLNGAGPIGLMTGEALLYAGAEHVVVVDNSEDRLERARSLGMSTVNFAEKDPVVAVRELFSEHKIEDGTDYGAGADIVLNTAPSGIALDNGYRAARDQGLIVDMAYYAQPILVAKGQDFHHRGLIDRSGQIGNIAKRQRPEWTRRRLAESGLEIIQSRGELIRPALITHNAEFADAPGVFDDYAARNPQRLITVFTPGDVTRLPRQPWDAPATAAA